MDAFEFLKERKRMCNSYKGCGGCPLERGNCGLNTSTSNEECERIVATVEKWSKEHPRKTRQSVFLEHYPEASLDANGLMQFCPTSISAAYRDRDSNGLCADPDRKCEDCRREFWMQEVE